MHADPNKRPALIVASVASFLTPFMESSMNIALAVVGREFEMDAVLLGWVSTAFLLSAAMFLVCAVFLSQHQRGDERGGKALLRHRLRHVCVIGAREGEVRELFASRRTQ